MSLFGLSNGYWLRAQAAYDTEVAERTFGPLLKNIKPLGMGHDDLHDNLNMFIKGFTDIETGQFVWESTDAKRGDYVEFYAEIDLLIAFSLCPYGGCAHVDLIKKGADHVGKSAALKGVSAHEAGE